MLHGEHIILRLTYISRYNNDNLNGEVTRILEQAQQNNERNGITGALVFNHNYFLQSIEGARPVINGLLRKLVQDERHHSLQVIECREVEQRHWSKWSMKYLIPSEENKGLALKFSTGSEFNPYLMSTNQITMLIDTLSELQEQQAKNDVQTIQKKKPWYDFS
ncbi:BLUF domain-containing protein [Psychrobacter sp. 1Y4]|uniref:BLUF domain-containing protein n=1 Tax=Psychrobacter sp. 1Y4 TaxID=3453575 RepID=UPI003F484CB9